MSQEKLSKQYEPRATEEKWYAAWLERGLFRPGSDEGAEPFSIVLPPPNVTGSLHMGHALNYTLQDILVRYHRMAGCNVLWQPGMDHAGIATQMVVERQLEAQGTKRVDLGREKFLERVWSWKAESGGMIAEQSTRLGSSADWSRERFTMDEGLSKAVVKVFVDLHREGLIYKDKRLVNWDCKFHTAISDLEVQQVETKGHLWYFKYPIEGQKKKFITVATTRPETMLGDTAVAVHPDDPRYKDLVGKNVILPLADRPIPIVADAYSDPEKGSGAVKITPAHDFNDFEVGKRHNLEMINIFDAEGHLNENAPKRYRGLDRFEVRDMIVKDLESLRLVEKIEDYEHTVPHGDRSHTVIEPWLTDQWFVDAATLAKPAMEAVQEGRTKFIPRQWENTYFEWMNNIQPWCISRQLWWGHQIPAWYGPDGECFVAASEEEAQAAADQHYGKATELTRDPDVLDTWFSSALWPFSTLGWPEKTVELERFYPTSVLVTGFDIIFFWVARMMMMGLHFMKDVPFKTVYIHALVRDEHGQKMSKSKGNVIDPLEVVDKFGADAFRFTMCALAAQGRDVRLAEGRVEGYRNFVTKIWNASRYILMQAGEATEDVHTLHLDPALASPDDQHIITKLHDTIADVNKNLVLYRFNDVANTLYDFMWHQFCDWYVEYSKEVFYGDDEARKAHVKGVMHYVYSNVLRLLHPIMPFVTEELWHGMGYASLSDSIMTAPWPRAMQFEELQELGVSRKTVQFVDAKRDLIRVGRTLRADYNIPPAQKVGYIVRPTSKDDAGTLENDLPSVQLLLRAESIKVDASFSPPNVMPSGLSRLGTVYMPLEGIVDSGAEIARLNGELGKVDEHLGRVTKKLGNENFVRRAPAEVVSVQKKRKDELLEKRDKLRKMIDTLAEQAG